MADHGGVLRHHACMTAVIVACRLDDTPQSLNTQQGGQSGARGTQLFKAPSPCPPEAVLRIPTQSQIHRVLNPLLVARLSHG